MVRSLVFVVACIMVVPVAAGHAYNHGTRHEDCQSYLDPATHGIADGHVHWHHNAPSAGHFHNATWFPDGHTHAATMHDPCNQVGMQRPAWANATALDELPVAAAVIDHDPLAENVIVRGEAYKLPVPSLRVQDDLIVRGDAELAAMGFPGSGTPTDPYVIAGYHVRNVLMVKDTSVCVVVRDNIVHSDAVLGELIDPADVVDPMAVVRALADRVADLERELAAAQMQVNASQAAVDAALDALAEAAAELAAAEDDAETAEGADGAAASARGRGQDGERGNGQGRANAPGQLKKNG